MRIDVANESVILLYKENDIIDASIDDADIELSIFFLATDNELQLFARANSSRASEISKRVEKGNNEVVDCCFLQFGWLHSKIKLSEKILGSIVDCVVSGRGGENLLVNGGRW